MSDEKLFSKTDIAALNEAVKSVEYVKSVIKSYREGKEMIEKGKAMMEYGVSELADTVRIRLEAAAVGLRPLDEAAGTAIATDLSSAALDAALVHESDPKSVEEGIDKIEDWLSCVEQEVDNLIGL